MTEIKLYKSTARGLKLMGLCLPFVSVAVWMISREPYGTTDYIWGWVCACLFGLGFPVGLSLIFDKRPQIIMTENGIWDRTTKQDEIKWEQIILAYPIEIYRQKIILLSTDGTFKFKKEPPKWEQKINKAFGAGNLNLQITPLDIDENELADFINSLTKKNIKEHRKLLEAFKTKIENEKSNRHWWNFFQM